MFNRIIFLFFFLIPNLSIGQEVVKISTNDTNKIKIVEEMEGEEELGKRFFPLENIMLLSNWIIYDGKDQNSKVSECLCRQDTCTIYHYWPGGRLKSISKYKNGFVHYEKLICENGVVLKERNPLKRNESDTTYYCNGKIKTIYDKTSNNYSYWLENGNAVMEGVLYNSRKEGLWKIYGDNNKIVRLLIHYYVRI